MEAGSIQVFFPTNPNSVLISEIITSGMSWYEKQNTLNPAWPVWGHHGPTDKPIAGPSHLFGNPCFILPSQIWAPTVRKGMGTRSAMWSRAVMPWPPKISHEPVYFPLPALKKYSALNIAWLKGLFVGLFLRIGRCVAIYSALFYLKNKQICPEEVLKLVFISKENYQGTTINRPAVVHYTQCGCVCCWRHLKSTFVCCPSKQDTVVGG